MTSAMKPRQLLLACMLLPLAGCVSVGATDFLVTPVAVVGVYSFAPKAPPADEAAVDRREAALRE